MMPRHQPSPPPKQWCASGDGTAPILSGRYRNGAGIVSNGDGGTRRSCGPELVAIRRRRPFAQLR